MDMYIRDKILDELAIVNSMHNNQATVSALIALDKFKLDRGQLGIAKFFNIEGAFYNVSIEGATEEMSPTKLLPEDQRWHGEKENDFHSR